MAEVQGRVDTIEEKVGVAVDRKLDALAERLRGDMRLQIREEMQEVREQGNMLHNQLQQFMLMFSGQTQARISPDFPPRERSAPILPGVGVSN